MLTELGKFLRKLRIDHNELLKDMADALDVSAAFLSAVETGKKNPPNGWREAIVKTYQLKDAQYEAFCDAWANSKDQVIIPLNGLPRDQRRVIHTFARQFENMDEDSAKRMKEILQAMIEKRENIE
jgi:transcriptional regulator with XRE-family HTH domain